MRKWIWVVLLAAGVRAAQAANGPFGLGVIIGEPTGLSANYYLDKERKYSVDAAVAWTLSGDNEFNVSSDYLYHYYGMLEKPLHITSGKLPLYFGVGARLKLMENADDKFGMRIPVGVAYQFAEAPLEAFAEVVPIVDLAPDTKLAWNGGVGIRFHF
jgi:hypothetical protein